MYEPYASAKVYKTYGSGGIPSQEVKTYLRRASRQIDTLTYNRIMAVGFDNLTEFQQELIQEACCFLADFLYDNAELLDSALDSYSINGVSINFGGTGMTVINGIPVRKDIYALLSQSGLCTANLHWRRYNPINTTQDDLSPDSEDLEKYLENATATMEEFMEAMKSESLSDDEEEDEETNLSSNIATLDEFKEALNIGSKR